MATDADLAGEIAAQRAFWMLTARGDTPRHVPMPNGQDPAEVLQHAGQTVLHSCLNDAAPLARHLLDERLNHLDEGSMVLPECAAVIAAQPSDTWVEQIDYVTARTNPGPGVVQQAIADAAQLWTLDPLGEAQGQISNRATVRARLQRAAQAPLSSDGQGDLVSAAAAAATQRLHGGQLGEPNSSGTAADTTTQELPPLEVWRERVRSIDSRLTTCEDWPMLAPAIQEAHAAGRDVARELSHLAAEGRLSTEHPATELAYRLRGSTQTISDTESTLGPEQKQAAVSPLARSQLGTQPSRRDPGRPVR